VIVVLLFAYDKVQKRSDNLEFKKYQTSQEFCLPLKIASEYSYVYKNTDKKFCVFAWTKCGSNSNRNMHFVYIRDDYNFDYGISAYRLESFSKMFTDKVFITDNFTSYKHPDQSLVQNTLQQGCIGLSPTQRMLTFTTKSSVIAILYDHEMTRQKDIISFIITFLNS
jgi:hypothetical protein